MAEVDGQERRGSSMSQLSLKVIPGAARAGIVGWLGESLKIKVTAVPEKGRANREVIALLSEALNISPSAITIVRGGTSPLKLAEIAELSIAEIKTRLQKKLSSREST